MLDLLSLVIGFFCGGILIGVPVGIFCYNLGKANKIVSDIWEGIKRFSNKIEGDS